MEFFLTEYDPSDLPGGSVDPLGFDRAYQLLADRLLPGLTNAGNQARYFSLLCGALVLAGDSTGTLPTARERERREAVILRAERFWAVANVLASEANPDLSASGIRGVTYARTQVQALRQDEASTCPPRFRLLSRQPPYGVLGIYAPTAEVMRLLDRKHMELTPELGEDLGRAFLKETEPPRALKEAIRDGGEAKLTHLLDWGRRAHVAVPAGEGEANVLRQALLLDPVRARTAGWLQETPWLGDEDDELQRLARVEARLAATGPDADLRESLEAVRSFEAAFGLVSLGLERLLWLARTTSGGAVVTAHLQRDEVLNSLGTALPPAAQDLVRAVDALAPRLRPQEAARLREVQTFLEQAASAQDAAALTDALLARHREVQSGKLDRGKRKMPWLERVDGRLQQTSARARGDARVERTRPEDILPHPYRLTTADQLLNGGPRP